MFTPRFAISDLAKDSITDHVYDAGWSRVWHKCRFLEHSSGRRQHADQSSDVEKGHQVSQMGSIYSVAQKVASDLGMDT